MTWPITRFVSPPLRLVVFLFVLPVDVRLLFGRSPDDDKANNFFSLGFCANPWKRNRKIQDRKKHKTEET
jgi:hypothetical protein